MIVVTRIGFAPDSVTVAPADTAVSIALHSTAEIEGMIVSATRSDRRIEDDPLRVEVLDREEVEEKLRMTPGDITMMLNETSGLRVQTTSPSLGGADVRVQGLRGRYTQILSDGLPLFGGQTGGLGLLQIPPMDLGGVEVIKGVASALYGGNALGGVINLRSRLPGFEPVAELLANQTTRGGSDLVGFASRKFGAPWGASALIGLHRQSAGDVDRDGWADLPAYERLVIRARLYWESEAGHSLMVTAGSTFEDRDGGTMKGAVAPDGNPYPEALTTARHDAGGVARWVSGPNAVAVRGSFSGLVHDHDFGPVGEHDRHLSSLAEVTYTRTSGSSSAVVGAAHQADIYRNTQVPAMDFDHLAPGVFAQVTTDLHPRLAITASGRYDQHDRYGAQFSPRVSALVRAPASVTVRLSGGEGFFAPTPLTEETEVTGLTAVVPLTGIVAERARTFSADFARSFDLIELNATVFASEIRHSVSAREELTRDGVPTGRLRLENMEQPTRTSGIELTSRWAPEPFHFNLSYTFIDAREQAPLPDYERLVPLTPRHQAGLVGSWESEDARAGVEVYYTGRQSLTDNPYRAESKPYTHLGALVERRVGAARIFVNAENLFGFRQTRWDRLVRPDRGPGGRWTTDVWGPLEGRTMNVGVRVGR